VVRPVVNWRALALLKEDSCSSAITFCSPVLIASQCSLSRDQKREAGNLHFYVKYLNSSNVDK
jgi:hypothetical protein